MYACPHCSQPAFTWWQKMNASAISPVACASCGKFSSTCFLPHTWLRYFLYFPEAFIFSLIVIPSPSSAPFVVNSLQNSLDEMRVS